MSKLCFEKQEVTTAESSRKYSSTSARWEEFRVVNGRNSFRTIIFTFAFSEFRRKADFKETIRRRSTYRLSLRPVRTVTENFAGVEEFLSLFISVLSLLYYCLHCLSIFLIVENDGILKLERLVLLLTLESGMLTF